MTIRKSLISVIIPVYNVEKYLRQCVESVLTQTYSDFEVILIDDGSTDGSPKICDSLAAADHRISVVHTPNSGPSAARNTGIRKACGEFITFIDSDDAVSPYYLQTLHSLLRESGADMAQTGFTYINESESPAERHSLTDISTWKNIVTDSDTALANMLYQRELPTASACGKLYHTDFLRKIEFTEGIIYEDLEISYRIISRLKKVAVKNIKHYYYRSNPASILHTVSERRADVLDVTEKIYDDACHRNRRLKAAAADRCLSAAFNIFCLASIHNLPSSIADRCWKTIMRFRASSLLDRNVRLRNKVAIIASYIGGRSLTILLGRIFYR